MKHTGTSPNHYLTPPPCISQLQPHLSLPPVHPQNNVGPSTHAPAMTHPSNWKLFTPLVVRRCFIVRDIARLRIRDTAQFLLILLVCFLHLGVIQ